MRKPDNEILVRSDPHVGLAKRHKLLNIPVLRGAVSFFETLYLGLGALQYSADVALTEAEKADKGLVRERTRGEKARDKLLLAGSILLAFGIAIGFFFALPLFLTQVAGLSENALSFNVVAGIIRVSFLMAYLWAISRWAEIKRMFAYHGAEHKTVHAFESGEELTVENVRKYEAHHPRCGTSFLLIVVILAVLLFGAADAIVQMRIGHRPTFLQRFTTHFSLLPHLCHRR